MPSLLLHLHGDAARVQIDGTWVVPSRQPSEPVIPLLLDACGRSATSPR